MPRSRQDSSEPASWAQTDEPLLWLHGAAVQRMADRRYFYDARSRTDSRHVNLQVTIAGTGFYENARGRTRLPRGMGWIDVIPGPFRYGEHIEQGAGVAPRVPLELVFVSFKGEEAFRWHERLTKRF